MRLEPGSSKTPFKATIGNAEEWRVHTMLVIGGHDLEAGAVSVRLHRGGPQGANAVQLLTNNVTKTKRVAVVNNWFVMDVGQSFGGDDNFIDYLGITAVSPSLPDGLDDWWQTLNCGSATNNLAAPGADPDGDRASNWTEYHFGTNPNSSASRPLITASLPTPSTVRLQWSSATDHVFRIDQSTNPIAWSVALDQVAATNATTTATVTRVLTAPQGFYRIIPIAP
jgi:hypothetical protein